MKLTEAPMRVMQKLGPGWMWDLEERLAKRAGVLGCAPDSPVRFEIAAEAMRRGHRPPPSARAMPHMMASMLGIRKALRSVDENPARPRREMPVAEVAEMEAFARAAGADDVGYARVTPHMVFQGKAVLHEHAIVMTMEMDKANIDSSPSEASYVEVHQTYHHLGTATIKIAEWLRERGYSAQAGPPLMGVALYPPLAQQAGLGWRGMHGLLITPGFGPRVRLAAVFTSIENLPVGRENEHGWIEGYCNKCRLCVKACPAGAILEDPIRRENGLMTCTVDDRCFPYFVENYGCSICIKVCPFQKQGYETLKKHV